MESRMNDRSSFSLRRTCLAVGLLLGCTLSAPGCGPPNGALVTDAARAGCEMETDVETATNANMLPGRDCGYCHHAGGQATNSPWTVSGTVYGSPNSPCNSGGLGGVVVQVLDPTFKCKN